MPTSWRASGGLKAFNAPSRPQESACCCDLAIAFAEVHERGQLRGELCTSDVLLDEAGEARLSPLDFSNLVREEGQVAGNLQIDRESLSYMTPERFYGHPPSVRSDQYSLDLLATELLGGSPIPRVVHPADLLHKPAFFEHLDKGEGAWAARSPEFAGVVSRMLRRDPDERWGSMAEVQLVLASIDVESNERLSRIASASYLRLHASPERQRAFFERFYQHLLTSADDLRPLFASIDMERQYKLVNAAILALLAYSPADASRAELSQLAVRHAALGLTRRHYRCFLDALLHTVQGGDGADAETVSAWRETIRPGLDFMSEDALRVSAVRTGFAAPA
jgi:hemoglobin-like flavoprotein